MLAAGVGAAAAVGLWLWLGRGGAGEPEAAGAGTAASEPAVAREGRAPAATEGSSPPATLPTDGIVFVPGHVVTPPRATYQHRTAEWIKNSPAVQKSAAIDAIRADPSLSEEERTLAVRGVARASNAAINERAVRGPYVPARKVALIVARARFHTAEAGADLAPLDAELDVRELLRTGVEDRAAYDPLMAVFAERCAALRSHGAAEVRQMGEDCGLWLEAYERGSDWPTTTYP